MKVNVSEYNMSYSSGVDEAKSYVNLLMHWDKFHQVIRGCKKYPGIRYLENCSKCLHTGIDFPFLNAVYDTNISAEDINNHIISNIEFFAGTPFAWYVNDGDNILEKHLLSYGFTTPGNFYGMSSGGANKVFQSNNYIVIEEVASESQLSIFCDIIERGFQFSSSVAEPYKNIVQELQDRGDIKNYLAYYKGQPCATLSTIHTANSISFWNGATLDNYRRKGVCTYMAEYLVHINNKAEQYLTFLMSDAMAMGVCNSLGGKKIWKFKPYIYMA